MKAEEQANDGQEEGHSLLGRAKAVQDGWCAPAQCCCCSVPRWSRVPLALLITYWALAPLVYTGGHFLVYPGSSDRELPDTCKELEVPLAGGGTLPAIRCSWGTGPAGSCVPAVTFGGNAMDMYDSAVHMRRFFPEDLCWDVYSISMPGSQYAPRSGWTTMGQALSDAKALAAYVADKSGRKAVVLGWSLGSSVTTGLSAEAPELVQCALIGAPFVSMRAMALVFSHNIAFPWLYLCDEWPTKNWASQLKVPTVVFSPLKDTLIPPDFHKQVFDAVSSPKKHFVTKATSHMDFLGFRTMASELIRKDCV